MMENHIFTHLALNIVFLSAVTTKEQFTVQVPTVPLVAFVGDSIILPCHMSREMSAVSMEIRWFKESFYNLVYQFNAGQATVGSGYEDRVTLSPVELEKGNMSLVLRKVKVTDQGSYTCHVSDPSWYEEPSLNLLVKSQGAVPIIEVLRLSMGSLELGCHSHGWYPEPRMFWRDGRNQNITGQTEKPKQLAESGVYTISSHMAMKTANQGQVECVVSEPFQGVQLLSRVQFTESFGSTHTVKLYTSAVLIPAFVALVCTVAAGLYAHKQRKECADKLKDYKSLDTERKSLKTVNEDQRQHLSAVRTIPDSVWSLICEYEDDVTLDPATASNRLSVSDDRKSVVCQDKNNSLSDKTDRRFQDPIVHCVLAKDGFRSGRHYWEVCVADKTHWYVGVAKESVKREGNISFTQTNGFWVLRLNDCSLFASTDLDNPFPLPQKLIPRKVGVFLDCDKRQVSFYSVDDRCHIYTFIGLDKEKLYPFLSCSPQCKHPLCICPVDKSSIDGEAFREHEPQQQATSVSAQAVRAHHEEELLPLCKDTSEATMANHEEENINEVTPGPGQEEKKRGSKLKFPKPHLKWKVNEKERPGHQRGSADIEVCQEDEPQQEVTNVNVQAMRDHHGEDQSGDQGEELLRLCKEQETEKEASTEEVTPGSGQEEKKRSVKFKFPKPHLKQKLKEKETPSEQRS